MEKRPKLSFASFTDLMRQTFTAFGEDKVGRLAAALAYFTVFSISPLMLVIISIAALYFGGQADAAGAITNQIKQTVGEQPAKFIESMVQGMTDHGQSSAKPITATIIALAVALWGASGLFGALQDSLNTIWGVMPKPGIGIAGTLRQRFVSFAMVLGVGFLLLVSLLLSTALAAVSKWMNGAMGDTAIIGQVLNLGIGFFVTMLLFGAIFKVLPDVEIQWRDVWVGAATTSLLFTAGRLFLGWYLGKASVASPYGAAGSLVVLLLWVNYASTILFLGAEFTKVYADTFGSQIEPSHYAIAVTTESRARQGMTPHQSQKVVSGGPHKGTPKEPVKPTLTPEQRAAKVREQQLDFQYSLAVLAGGIMATLWFLRRAERK